MVGESLVIEADRDDLENISTRVEDGVLRIKRKSQSWFNFRRTKPIVYHLRVETISRLTLSGSVEAIAGAMSSDRLRIKVSKGRRGVCYSAASARTLGAFVSMKLRMWRRASAIFRSFSFQG